MATIPGFDWVSNWDMGPSPVSNYGSWDIQRYLPFPLWNFWGKKGAKYPSPFAVGLREGTTNLANLMKNPGSLPANVSESIAPRLAMESQAISRNTLGQQANAAGAIARSGSQGSGFASALAASIEQAGARQQAQARQGAIGQSAELQRADLQNVFKFYDLLLQFTNQARKYNERNRENRQDQYNKYVGGFTDIFSSLGNAFSSGAK